MYHPNAQTMIPVLSDRDKHHLPTLLIPAPNLQARGFQIQGQVTMLHRTSLVLTPLKPTMARIIFMLVTVRVYPFYTLDLPAFIHLTKHSTLNTFYMFQPLQKISFLFNSFVTTIMFVLNFILPFSL